MNKERIINQFGRIRHARPNGDHRTLHLLLTASAAGDETAIRCIEQLDSQELESTRKLRVAVEGRYVRALVLEGKTPFPALAGDVAAFLATMRGTHKFKTVAYYAQVIARGHVMRALPDPTQDAIVKRTLETLRREAGGRDYLIRPLFVQEYLTVRTCIPLDLRGSRDRLVFGLGFEGLLRAGEVRDLDVADVIVSDAGLLVNIRDQSHRRTVAINRRGPDDVLADFISWLELSGLKTGPLIRSIDRHGGLAPRTDSQTLRHIVKNRCTEAGFPAAHYGFYSLRQGYIASGLAAEVSCLQLAQKGGFRRPSGVTKYRVAAQHSPVHAQKLVPNPI